MSEDILFRTPELACRLLRADETENIGIAAAMDLLAWGDTLGQGPDKFASRAKNGYVVGVFQGEELVGTISAVRRRWQPVVDAKNDRTHEYATWDGVSSNGTFARHETDGDALYCVAITSKGASRKPYPVVPEGDHPALALARDLAAEKDATDPAFAAVAEKLAAATAPIWIPIDPVIRFHGKPKGGIVGGATVRFPLPGGRIDDRDAMGWNVIMTYPEFPENPTFPASIDTAVSSGETLILGAAALGARLGVKYVVPYSRPGALRHAIIKALVAIAAGTAGDDALTTAVNAFLA